MAKITLKGNTIQTSGELPQVGTSAPAATFVKTDLSEIKLEELKGKNVILNIFPSIDTPVCAMSVQRFNAEANKLKNTTVLCISQDLPFAMKRFCAAEGLDQVLPASAFRSDFGKNYGLTIQEGALKGLLARAVVILDGKGQVKYNELVPEIAQEPNYQTALDAAAEL